MNKPFAITLLILPAIAMACGPVMQEPARREIRIHAGFAENSITDAEHPDRKKSIRNHIKGIFEYGTPEPDPEEDEFPIPKHLIRDPFMIEFISVNGRQIPDASVNATLVTILRYVRGPITGVKGRDIELDPADDGCISEKQLSEIVKKRRACGKSAITVVTLPEMKPSRNGFCSWLGDGSKLVVLYADVLRRKASIFYSSERIFQRVFTHELGHALGVPYRKSHKWRGNHCTCPTCLMYQRVDIFSILHGIINLGPPLDFCEKCTAELAAARAPKDSRN
ncbi:MAG: zinc metalloprotease [Planctomycetota bacterium]